MTNTETFRPSIEIIAKETSVMFQDQKMLLRLPSLFRDMFQQLNPEFREDVFCQWELATSFDALKQRVEQMKEAGTMPVLLTFCKMHTQRADR